MRPASAARGIPTVAAISRSGVPRQAHREDRPVGAAEPLRGAPLQPRRDRRQRPLAADRRQQLVRAARLVDDRRRAREGRRHDRVEARARRVEHDARPRVPRPHRQAELQLVDDHDVGVGAVEQRQQRVPVGGGADRHDPGRVAQDRLQAGAHRRVGIEDRDADHASASRPCSQDRAREARTVRDGEVADDRDRQPGGDVEQVVVRGRDRRERHERPPRQREHLQPARAARRPRTAIPIAIANPQCRLGTAAIGL